MARCPYSPESKDSKIYPGIARQQNPNGRGNPADPAAPRPAITIAPAPYSRKVAVYVPRGYAAGTEIPFLVAGDYREDPWLFVATDNLIAEKKIPPMVVVWIANGGSDGQGSQRGLEYDTMSGKYAEFVETEVLPLVEKQYNVKLTKNPEGRAALGCSSGAAAAMSMAWYRTDLYHRVVSFSGTFVYQQWPPNPETPHGAWDYHETIIPYSPKKPLRIWMAGERPRQLPEPRRLPRLGGRQRAHGPGPRRQRLPVKRLAGRVVPRIAFARHANFDAVGLEKICVILAGVLGAAIGMMDQPGLDHAAR